jgi:hypothetical protein
MMDVGLTAIHTEELKKFLRLVIKDQLVFPLTRQQLLLRGLNLMGDRGDLLFGLDQASVKAILIAVLAERQKMEKSR